MPKQISESELNKIVSVIKRHPEGIQSDTINEQLDIRLPLYTLQRRLKKLYAEKRIKTEGRGTGKRYYPINNQVLTGAEKNDSGATFNKMPVSNDGIEVMNLVARPVSERNPVGYLPEFLDSYIPNKSVYIPEALRQELAEIGEVGVKDLPAGTYLRKIMDRLLIDLSWNSSRLEGNTYSLLETQRLLEDGESAEGKAIEETQMILNHKAVIELLADQASEIGFNRYTICNIHALLSDNLLADPSACGRLRSRGVGINKSVFHPLSVPQQIEASFLKILEKASAINDPFEQSFFVMVHFPYLQPFEGVNKRVSRLAANIPFIKYNLCPLSFIDVPQAIYVNGLLGIYELNRVELLRDVFVWAYKRSTMHYSAVRQSLGEPDPFRLRYRKQIGEFVHKVVVDKMEKAKVSNWIRNGISECIPEPEQHRFVEVVETELSNLHEGNIARYGLRPSELEQWWLKWTN